MLPLYITYFVLKYKNERRITVFHFLNVMYVLYVCLQKNISCHKEHHRRQGIVGLPILLITARLQIPID